MTGRCALAALFVLGLVASGCSRQPSAEQISVWDAEIKRLEAVGDSLEKRGQELVAGDPRLHRMPKGDAVIIIPTSFVRDVIGHVFEDVAGNVTLRLGGLKAHVAKSVKKIVTIGEFTVDVNIDEVVGKLAPDTPDIVFADDRIRLSLPVRLSEGRGRSTLRFVWDGKNVADLACGDMDVTRVVTGEVVPARYVMSGTLQLGMRGSVIVCTPKFPETRVRIRVTPSKQSWATVDSLLAEKEGVCGYVLDKVDVKAILARVTEEKGFNVKLPVDKIKAFRIPAGVRDSVTVGNRTIAVSTSTNAIRVEPDAILYSATVRVK